MQSFMAGSRLGYGLLAKLANGQRANLDLSKRGADLSRGPQALSKLPAAAWSNTWPAPAATLDLDFANNRGFVRGSGQGGAMDAVTFTRASSGNWVDNTGTLRTGAGTFTGTANALGVNLLSVPQNFDNAYWTKSNSTIIVNAVIAPDGTLTANKLVENTSTSSHYIRATAASGNSVSVTVSCYCKAAERNWMSIASDLVVPNALAAFDLFNGTTGTSTNCTSAIADAGNGWYRCSITFTSTTASSTNFAAAFYTGTSNTAAQSYTGDGTSGIYIWGAQLEVGSSATTYYPTNINAPRFDWASTAVTPNVNQLTNTENFSAWTITVAGSVTIASDTGLTTDPLGGNTADAIYETSAASVQHQIYNASTSVVAGVTYTYSAYIKSNGRTKVRFGGISTSWGSKECYFDLTAVTATPSVDSLGSISAIGNGWYRCSWTASANSTQGGLPARQTIMILDDSGNQVYTGDPTKGIFIWGAQMEQGSSATAYQSIGAQVPTNTPLVASSTCNGLLIEESRTNRILWCRDGRGINAFPYSQAFSQSTWSKTGLSASDNTADTTAPDGTSTASKITITGGFARIAYTASVPSSTYTFSVCIKKGATNVVISLINQTTSTTFATFDPDAPSGNYTSLGNGWYRFWGSGTVSAGNELRISAANEGIGEYFYLWGAQLEIGSSFTSYDTTTSNWAAFIKTNVTAAKDQTGIDGVANSATTLTASANNGTCIQTITLASGSRTGSVYLKRITGTGNVQVTLDGSTWSTVDLSNGLWNRIVLSGTVTNPCVGVLLATNGDAVAMDYAQVEDNGEYVGATSPILTTTATVTRAVDSATISQQITQSFYNNGGGEIACRYSPFSVGRLNNLYMFTFYGSSGLAPFIRGYRQSGNGYANFDIYGSNAVYTVQLLRLNGSYYNTISNPQYFSASYSMGEVNVTFNDIAPSSVANNGPTANPNRSANSNNPPINRLNFAEYNGAYSTLYLSRFIYSPKTTTMNGLANLGGGKA